eukprot:12566736-Ditylum_brightwellii.AAC.1
MVEKYYAGMPASVTVNRNAQFFLGIKKAIRATDVKMRIACSVVGTWCANAFSQAKEKSSIYKSPNFQHTSSLAAFVCDILLDNGLLTLCKADVPLADDGTKQ